MNLKLFYINENGQSLNIKQFKAMYLHISTMCASKRVWRVRSSCLWHYIHYLSIPLYTHSRSELSEPFSRYTLHVEYFRGVSYHRQGHNTTTLPDPSASGMYVILKKTLFTHCLSRSSRSPSLFFYICITK